MKGNGYIFGTYTIMIYSSGPVVWQGVTKNNIAKQSNFLQDDYTHCPKLNMIEEKQSQ